MIVRIWHGRTRRERADAYAEFVAARAIPEFEPEVIHYTVVASG